MGLKPGTIGSAWACGETRLIMGLSGIPFHQALVRDSEYWTIGIPNILVGGLLDYCLVGGLLVN